MPHGLPFGGSAKSNLLRLIQQSCVLKFVTEIGKSSMSFFA